MRSPNKKSLSPTIGETSPFSSAAVGMHFQSQKHQCHQNRKVGGTCCDRSISAESDVMQQQQQQDLVSSHLMPLASSSSSSSSSIRGLCGGSSPPQTPPRKANGCSSGTTSQQHHHEGPHHSLHLDPNSRLVGKNLHPFHHLSVVSPDGMMTLSPQALTEDTSTSQTSPNHSTLRVYTNFKRGGALDFSKCDSRNTSQHSSPSSSSSPIPTPNVVSSCSQNDREHSSLVNSSVPENADYLSKNDSLIRAFLTQASLGDNGDETSQEVESLHSEGNLWNFSLLVCESEENDESVPGVTTTAPVANSPPSSSLLPSHHSVNINPRFTSAQEFVSLLSNIDSQQSHPTCIIIQPFCSTQHSTATKHILREAVLVNNVHSLRLTSQLDEHISLYYHQILFRLRKYVPVIVCHNNDAEYLFALELYDFLEREGQCHKLFMLRKSLHHIHSKCAQHFISPKAHEERSQDPHWIQHNVKIVHDHLFRNLGTHSREWIRTNPPTRITKHLYLGCAQNSFNKQQLLELNVSGVINAARECESHYSDTFKYLECDLDDHPHEDISQYFDLTFSFIEQIRRKRGVCFVHCFVGASRSVTIIIAYLMRKKNWTFQRAYRYVSKRRAETDVNYGFCQQLMDYEKKLEEKRLRASVKQANNIILPSRPGRASGSLL